MIRRLKDITLVIHDTKDIELCRAAFMGGGPITIQRHHGYVIKPITEVADGVRITLRHTGVPQCDCKEDIVIAGWRDD